MAFTENNGTKIFWTEQGAGFPLLLIMGLGGSHKEWRRILPQLAEKYRAITFDNRGVGETIVSDEPFTIPTMAADAKAVLDAAGVESAHILGMSNGRNDRAGIRFELPGNDALADSDRYQLRRQRNRFTPNPKFISRCKVAASSRPKTLSGRWLNLFTTKPRRAKNSPKI